MLLMPISRLPDALIRCADAYAFHDITPLALLR